MAAQGQRLRLTFDHNCLIHLENGGAIADCIRALLGDSRYECFVVNVGASEMQRLGVRPDNYGAFESLLVKIGVAGLPRLDPMGFWDVTFWDHCVWCGPDDEELFDEIHAILFPSATSESDAIAARKLLNRICDTLTLWCHVSYKNDVFVTTDENFKKQTKLSKLAALGVGSISHPCDLMSSAQIPR